MPLISARYITQVVNPELLQLLGHEGNVLFQQDNTRPHTAAVAEQGVRITAFFF